MATNRDWVPKAYLPTYIIGTVVVVQAWDSSTTAGVTALLAVCAFWVVLCLIDPEKQAEKAARKNSQ